jgi:hypothetical protein
MVHMAILLALPMSVSSAKLETHRIDGLKICSKNECNIMIIAGRSPQHPSSGANRPSDVAVTVNINAQFNQS